MLTAYACESFDVHMCEALMQELSVGLIFAVSLFGGRVCVHVDAMFLVELVEGETHVGTTRLSCAAAAACEGVCAAVNGGEGVASCAGRGHEGEGVAVSVHSREDRVVCGMDGVEAASVPQGAEDAHRHLSLRDDATQYALAHLFSARALADEEFVSSRVACEAVWAVVVALCECEVWVDVVYKVARGLFGKGAIKLARIATVIGMLQQAPARLCSEALHVW